MGEVHLAVRAEGTFRRIYAIKRLPLQLRDDDSLRRMFLEEARLSGLIRHPNVVSVLDIGDDAEGPYLLMDYVEGVTIAQIIRRAHEREELVPMPIALSIAVQAASGLAAAHALRRGDGEPLRIVHRDISPVNVLAGFDGIVRIADFGIAKSQDRGSRTTTGVLRGKLGYMSPEQLRFETIDHRSDLFSFGVTLYELLGACRLYDEPESNATAQRILREEPPDIGDCRHDVHPLVVQLLFRLLAKRPEDRPESTDDVVHVLEDVLAVEIERSGGMKLRDYLEDKFAAERRRAHDLLEDSMRRSDEAARRRRWPLATAAILGCALVAGGGVALLTGSPLGAEARSPNTETRRRAPGFTFAETEAARPPSPSPSFADSTGEHEIRVVRTNPSPREEPGVDRDATDVAATDGPGVDGDRARASSSTPSKRVGGEDGSKTTEARVDGTRRRHGRSTGKRPQARQRSRDRGTSDDARLLWGWD